VRTQLAEGLPRVQGDRVQLQQVLLNLIINAIEAMRDVGEEERELLISTRNEPDGVSVRIAFKPIASGISTMRQGSCWIAQSQKKLANDALLDWLGWSG
jgi:signal transduction histidine kinase